MMILMTFPTISQEIIKNAYILGGMSQIREMGQILPEYGDISHLLLVTDEELEQFEFESDERRLTRKEYGRFRELWSDMNGSLPKHLNYRDSTLAEMVEKMTPAQVQAMNKGPQGLDDEGDFSSRPHRIIGKTAEYNGRYDIVFAGRKYIGATSAEMMYLFVRAESKSKDPQRQFAAELLCKELEQVCPYSLVVQWNAKK